MKKGEVRRIYRILKKSQRVTRCVDWCALCSSKNVPYYVELYSQLRARQALCKVNGAYLFTGSFRDVLKGYEEGILHKQELEIVREGNSRKRFSINHRERFNPFKTKVLNFLKGIK